MTKSDESQQALPGMDYTAPSSKLRQAVETTLRALQKEELLEERHAAMAQLALELADAVTEGNRRGRASAVAMAAGQLRDTLLALPAPLAADLKQKFDEFVTSLIESDST